MEEMKPHPTFDRDIAFSRTIGFVTKPELEILKNKTVAIAGLGGVGGNHILTLTRLGIGGFHIADMDVFGLENFNRQAGASLHTLGKSKLEVMKEMALAINPELRIEIFPEGLQKHNVNEFFKGVDFYADSLDFFAFQTRSLAFDHCYRNNIPATTVGPIGMGAALLNFLPGELSFHDYFQWQEGDDDLTLGVKFLLGLTPKVPHVQYLVDRTAMKLEVRKGPSTPMGCELCAGVMGSEALKILLKRGPVRGAPHSMVLDAYHNKIFHRYIRGGNRNPLQKLKIAFLKKKIQQSLQKKS